MAKGYLSPFRATKRGRIRRVLIFRPCVLADFSIASSSRFSALFFLIEGQAVAQSEKALSVGLAVKPARPPTWLWPALRVATRFRACDDPSLHTWRCDIRVITVVIVVASYANNGQRGLFSFRQMVDGQARQGPAPLTGRSATPLRAVCGPVCRRPRPPGSTSGHRSVTRRTYMIHPPQARSSRSPERHR